MKSLIVSVLIVFATLVFATQIVSAQDPFEGVCSGGRAANSSVCSGSGTTDNPLFGASGVITKVAQILVIIAGVASVFMIMIGGFKYMTSTGDSAKVNSAKDTILYAIIGLIVTVFAQSIVTFVLTRL